MLCNFVCFIKFCMIWQQTIMIMIIIMIMVTIMIMIMNISPVH